MTNAASGEQPTYFPSPRSEVADRLCEGDKILDQAMANTEKLVRAGHVLVETGEPQGLVYRLVSGKAARIRVTDDGRRQIICIFGPGDLMAVKAMLLDRQPDNVECLSPARVRSLGYTEVLALAVQQPSVSLRLMWQLAEDERRLHNNVTMLGRGTAIERISTALLDLQVRLSSIGGESEPVNLRQQDLADYLGLTLVHVNRTLRALREQGALETRNHGIFLRDLATLHRHAAPMLDVFERDTALFGAGVN
jgi:CRP-like cAMP-binding protein